MAALTMLTPLRNSSTGLPLIVPATKRTPLTLYSRRPVTLRPSAIHSGSKAEMIAVRGSASSRRGGAGCATLSAYATGGSVSGTSRAASRAAKRMA